MQKLNKYTYDYQDLYDRIVKNKKPKKDDSVGTANKQVLLDLKQTIFKTYDEYESLLNNCSYSHISLTDSQGDLIRDLYKNQSKLFKTVYRDIREKTLPIRSDNRCPYCDLDIVESIDHFLPKEYFPQYSVYPPNLVPCCSKCNVSKGNDWKTNDGKRAFIHFYFDELPQEKVFYVLFNHLDLSEFKLACIKPNNSKSQDIITFKFHDAVKDVKNTFLEIIINHYSKLDLFKRYNSALSRPIGYIYDEVESHIFSLREHKTKLIDINIIKTSILRQLETTRKRLGYYHWELIVQTALIEDNDFLMHFVKKNDINTQESV